MSEYTVPELIEQTLETALKAAAHQAAYDKSWGTRDSMTPAKQLSRSAHYWAAIKHDEMADNSWKCLKWVQS